MSYETALAELKKLKRGACATDRTDKSPSIPPSVSFVSSQLGASQNFFSDSHDEREADHPAESAGAARQRLSELPLTDKLRIYGKPWPLEINGRVVCWLVADDEAAEACNKAEPVYTAAEVQHMAKLPAEDVREIHELKSRFGGTVMNAEFSESAPSATDKTDNEVTA